MNSTTAAPTAEKPCRICGRSKPLDPGFYKAPRNRDGHRSECKDCINTYLRLRDHGTPVTFAEMAAANGYEAPRNRAPAGQKKKRDWKKVWADRKAKLAGREVAKLPTTTPTQPKRATKPAPAKRSTRKSPTPPPVKKVDAKFQGTQSVFSLKNSLLRWVPCVQIDYDGAVFTASRGRTREGLSLPVERMSYRHRGEIAASSVQYYIDGNPSSIRRETDVIRELTRIGIL